MNEVDIDGGWLTARNVDVGLAEYMTTLQACFSLA
jgi:hypothetical protein